MKEYSHVNPTAVLEEAAKRTEGVGRANRLLPAKF